VQYSTVLYVLLSLSGIYCGGGLQSLRTPLTTLGTLGGSQQHWYFVISPREASTCMCSSQGTSRRAQELRSAEHREGTAMGKPTQEGM